jgi:hypothetical protein
VTKEEFIEASPNFSEITIDFWNKKFNPWERNYLIVHRKFSAGLIESIWMRSAIVEQENVLAYQPLDNNLRKYLRQLGKKYIISPIYSLISSKCTCIEVKTELES